MGYSVPLKKPIRVGHLLIGERPFRSSSFKIEKCGALGGVTCVDLGKISFFWGFWVEFPMGVLSVLQEKDR